MSGSSEAVPNTTRVTGLGFGTEHAVRLSVTVGGARQQPIPVFRSETNRTGSIVRERSSMTSEAVTDRRVRRTRELLRGALLSLIMEKGYERITVQDILDRADVGRSTFYAHYRDKEALLLAGFEDIRSALTVESEAAEKAAGSHREFLQPMLAVFRHVEGHRQFWEPLSRKGGADLAMRILRENVEDLVRTHFHAQFPQWKGDPMEFEATMQFVTGACMRLLTWWLDNDEVTYSAEEIHSTFRRLVSQGVRRFLATP
jgi:AcrR family transcriptional regulator